MHNPLWALRGHLMLFDEWRHDDASGAPPQLRSLSSSAMRGAAEAAQAALLSTAATDAVLLVPPGALALAALRIGFDQVPTPLVLPRDPCITFLPRHSTFCRLPERQSATSAWLRNFNHFWISVSWVLVPQGLI